MIISKNKLIFWACFILILSLLSMLLGTPHFVQIYYSYKSEKLMKLVSPQIKDNEKWKDVRISVSPKGPLFIYGFVYKGEDKNSLKQLIDDNNTFYAKVKFIVDIGKDKQSNYIDSPNGLQP